MEFTHLRPRSILPSLSGSYRPRFMWAEKYTSQYAAQAGFDEGILSLGLFLSLGLVTILFCMWNPYRYNKFQ